MEHWSRLSWKLAGLWILFYSPFTESSVINILASQYISVVVIGKLSALQEPNTVPNKSVSMPFSKSAKNVTLACIY